MALPFTNVSPFQDLFFCHKIKLLHKCPSIRIAIKEGRRKSFESIQMNFKHGRILAELCRSDHNCLLVLFADSFIRAILAGRPSPFEYFSDKTMNHSF